MPKNKILRIFSAVAATLLLAGVLAGCGGSGATKPAQPSSGSGQQGAPAQAPAPSEIKLGAVFPLTGKESKPGGWFKKATELAIKEANDKGGLSLGGTRVKINLEMLDDQTDATKSAQLVEQLITQKKVHAIIGGYSTNLVNAQSVVPTRYKIPYVNGGGAATSIYSAGSKWVFGTLSPVEVLATTQMDFLKEQVEAGKLPKPLKIALVWEDTEHGKDYQKGVLDRAKQFPDLFKVVHDEKFTLYAPDFTALLTKVKTAGADVFLVDAHIEDYVTMHRQYTQMGLQHKMVTYGARGSEKAAKDALGVATDHVFASSWWTDKLPYPQVKTFLDKWKAAYNGETPEWYAAIAYEAARMLLTGIEKAGSVEPEKIQAALVGLELKDSILPGQTLKFSQTGQAIYPFVVVQNKPGGKTDIVYPKDAATGPAVAPIPGR